MRIPPELVAQEMDPNPIILPRTSPRSSANQNLSAGVCPCSPSARGHPRLDHPKVKTFIALVREFVSMDRTSERAPVVQSKLKAASRAIEVEFGREGYVNLEAALRPKLRMNCMYDIKSGRNLIPRSDTELVSTKSCDQSPRWAAPRKALSTFVASPGPSPAPSPLPQSSAEPQANAAPQTNAEIVAQEFPVESPGVQETPVPGNTSSVTTPAPSASASVPRNINEGCVAIEHLAGHAVQHRMHLRRVVLCSRGFCATPNHAIIVDGVWTSMKSLCGGGWQCTEDVRLVNNLKISEATRLAFDSRIVITPYDVRFPVILSWTVQIAEDVVEIVLLAFAIAICIACTLFAFGREHVMEPVSTASKRVVLRNSRQTATSVMPHCRPNAMPIRAESMAAATHAIRC